MLAPARTGGCQVPSCSRTACAVSSGGSRSWDTVPLTYAVSPLCHGASGKVSRGWLGTGSQSADVMPLGNALVLGVDGKIHAAPPDSGRRPGRRVSGTRLQGLPPSPATAASAVAVSGYVFVGVRRRAAGWTQSSSSSCWSGRHWGDRGGARATSRGTPGPPVLLHACAAPPGAGSSAPPPDPPLSAWTPPRGAGRRPHGERPHGPLARRVERAADRLLLPPLRVRAGRHPPGHGAARAPQQRPQRRGGLHLRQVSPPLPVCACACVCTYTWVCACAPVRACACALLGCSVDSPSGRRADDSINLGSTRRVEESGVEVEPPQRPGRGGRHACGFPGMRLVR